MIEAKQCGPEDARVFMSLRRRKICFVVTEPMTVRAFLVDQLKSLSQRYDLTLVTNTSDESLLQSLGIAGRTVPLSLRREISTKADLAAAFQLWRLFRTERFDSVHSVTPKSGLLSALAGAAAGIPNRLHTFTGQVWSTRGGVMRRVLKLADIMIAILDTHVLADSSSQRAFLVEQGVLNAKKCSVLGKGSISGVDLGRFRPNAASRDSLRQSGNIPNDAFVFLFIGRLTRDKGIHDLLRAFSSVAESRPNSFLWVVGPDEQRISEDAPRYCGKYADRVRFWGTSATPESFMAAADVLCLPSYREGFGSVVIEAAASGIPAIVSRIYGLTDAVEENVTGLFHEPRNVEELATCMLAMAGDPHRRNRLSENAKRRAEKDFSKEILTSALLDLYGTLLRSRRFQRGWRLLVKRTLDIFGAAIGLVCMSPFLAITALLIRFTMGAPVLFRQIRPGKDHEPFTVLKFRTMTDARDDKLELLPDGRRLTRLGRLLRATSLDEFPQLWNVLRGEMSLVGPRPLLMEYLERYTPEQARRHEVLPGITGWAQINGRNALSWEEKFALDKWYVENWSLWVDLRVLAATAVKVLNRRGISNEAHATMPEFLGSGHQR